MAGTLAYHHLDGRNQHTVIASSPETLDGQARYRVIDGDTIEADYGAKYRLLGFDAPETRHSKCAEERVLGQQAAKRLKTLLASGEIHVIKSGGFDKRDRPLVRVIVDGRDVGEILISEGLALPYSPGICKKWC
ncbi:MAG: thermonuclease family protein [Hyphomicrobiales bacterium]|nr:thermonuclease family protein [Hyphomicrobiales bacterium]